SPPTLAQQQHRVRRRLASAADNATGNASIVYSEAPLRVGLGTHYAELYLGVPAQRASVIVDTGSHLTALPCSSCKGCGNHTDPFFDITKSTTAKFANCRDFSCQSCNEERCYISQGYTEGSMWQAVVVDELVWVGGFSGTNADHIMRHYGVRFPLGCQTKETGLFITQKENGIMGLGRHRSTVLSYMVSAKRVAKDVFSLCFGASGGSLVLGGVDYTHHTTDVAYTSLVADNSGWYPVKVKDIWVGGATIGLGVSELNSGKGVIVDSGTTDTFFVSAGSRSFLRAFERAAGIPYSETKMDVRKADFATLPNITVVLEGVSGGDDVELVIPPHKYLTVSDNGQYYYGNVHFSERSGGVLGASTMMGYDVIFDSESKRVGFAESDCDASSASLPAADSDSSGANATAVSIDASATTKSKENPLDSIHYGTFFAEILVVSLVGVVLLAVIWRRMKERSWYAVPGESMLGTPKDEDFSADDTDHDDDDNNAAPDSTTSTTAVRSPPRRQRVVTPRFTIGSDDEEEDERESGASAGPNRKVAPAGEREAPEQ
ncbi:hypothetical protein PybrP1_004602, partial [[Pythium] brassicae (nom. inval.)]